MRPYVYGCLALLIILILLGLAGFTGLALLLQVPGLSKEEL